MEDSSSLSSSSSFEKYHFHTIDYCVFGAMLILSATSGTYFGYFRKSNSTEKLTTSSINDEEDAITNNSLDINKEKIKKKTLIGDGDGGGVGVGGFGSTSMNEYLLGSRKLKPFPVAMSLVASYISGVTILGTPAEIYSFGTQYWLIIFPIILMGYTVSTVYLPVFSSLQIRSSYEYLELRFSSTVRTLASFMFVIDEILFLPIIIYVPSLAFNQVTGVNLYLIGGIVTVVCIFYTTIGGIKAVVHTDAWQVMVMFLSVVVVVVLGTIALGGTIEVFDLADKGERIQFFNMNSSMYERHTFWSVLIGGYSYWTSYNAVNQTMVQRYMSLPNLKIAKLTIGIFTVGIALFVSVCCYAGVLVYAAYFNCDPVLSGLVKTHDQILPVYVMETVGEYKGVPGLFIAGVFGAALSSLSVVLNSTAAVLLEDIFKGCFHGRPSEKAASYIVKGSVVLLGVFAMGFVFVVERLGGILEVATSLSAISASTTFGIFTLGMLIPWSNTYGAISGALVGALVSGWISFGSQISIAAGHVHANKLNISIDGCATDIFQSNNNTIVSDFLGSTDQSNVFPLYRLSFHWINPIGILCVLIVGTIVSFITGARNLENIDPELISPVIHRFLPIECFNNYGIKNIESKNSNSLNEESFTFLYTGELLTNNKTNENCDDIVNS